LFYYNWKRTKWFWLIVGMYLIDERSGLTFSLMSEINFLIPRLDKDCTEGRNNPFRHEWKLSRSSKVWNRGVYIVLFYFFVFISWLPESNQCLHILITRNETNCFFIYLSNFYSKLLEIHWGRYHLLLLLYLQFLTMSL